MVCTTDRSHYGFKSCEANDPKQTSAIEKWYLNRIKRAFGKYLNSCIKDVTRANLVILQNE